MPNFIRGTVASESGGPVPVENMEIVAQNWCNPEDALSTSNGTVHYWIENNTGYYEIDYSNFQVPPETGDLVAIHFINTTDLAFAEEEVLISSLTTPILHDVILRITVPVTLAGRTSFKRVVIPPHKTLKIHYNQVTGCGNTDVFQWGTNGWYKYREWNFNKYCTWRYIHNSYDYPVVKIIHNNDGFIRMDLVMDFVLYPSSPSNTVTFAAVNTGWGDNLGCEFGNIVSPIHTFEYFEGALLSDFPVAMGSDGVQQLDVQFESYDNIFWSDMELMIEFAEVRQEGTLHVSMPGASIPEASALIQPGQEVVVLNLGGILLPGSHTMTLSASGGLSFSFDCFNFSSVVPMIPDTLNLQNMTVADTSCFNATITITTAGEGSWFFVESGAIVHIIAGQNVKMLPHTHMMYGSNVHVYIDLTGDYCYNPRSEVSTPEEIWTNPAKVESNKQDFFMVYPNPTTGNFTVELTEPTEESSIRIEIYNILGESVINLEVPISKRYLIDLTSEYAGVYLIRVMKGNRVGTARIIKQ